MLCEYIMMCLKKKEKINGIRYLKKIIKYWIIKKNIFINLCDLMLFLNYFLYLFFCILSIVCLFIFFLVLLVVEYIYILVLLLIVLVMVSDGVLMELLLYCGLVVILRVVDILLVMCCYFILFWNGLELIIYLRVIVFL